MSANSKIEWCHGTVNHWAGCTPVSPACDNCYAKRMAGRLWGTEWGTGKPRNPFLGAGATLRAIDRKAHRLGHPLMVFHNSLSDFFDNEVPASWRITAMRSIVDTPNLIHLLLTKRIGNAAAMLDQAFRAVHGQRAGWADNVLPNVWLGATVVNQDEADRDIPKLLATPARVRFLSMEPLLGPVDISHLNDGKEVNEFNCLKPYTWEEEIEQWRGTEDGWEDSFEDHYGIAPTDGLSGPMHEGIDWVIVGGESGPKARPMHPDWARSLRDQCAAAGVPFLFKQWGEWSPINQQEEEFTNRLYKSNRIAALHEDQGNLDDRYGRRCTVTHTVVHMDGSTHGITEPMAFLQGTDAMTTFKVGKKAAGRLLDGIEYNGFPS